MSDVVLIVDDDADIRMFLALTLELHGFETVEAVDGEQGVREAVAHSPAVILMDVMMPRLDGIEAIRRLRRDGRVSHIPVIILTARAQVIDKVEGLTNGADDYITKPFDPEELVARVRATLRRAQQMRTVSPLTGLPGNTRIEQELHRRVDASQPFALLYADLNQFKEYNDHYGFMRGDEVLRGLASVIVEVVGELGDDETFVGHIGGDDFVVLTGLDRYEHIAHEICARFDARVQDHYDLQDRERGYIEVLDRQGVSRRFPPVSVSIGIATNEQRDFEHASQPVGVATEMKTFAKQACEGPSNWAVDRRTDDAVHVPPRMGSVGTASP